VFKIVSYILIRKLFVVTEAAENETKVHPNPGEILISYSLEIDDHSSVTCITSHRKEQ
jgi:hypothetical protein